MSANCSLAEKIELIRAQEAQLEWNRRNKFKVIHNTFYDWQHEFNSLTASCTSVLLMAANQVGKSRTGCTIDAFHLLGDYPENWRGHRFKKAPLCWLMGYSGEKTRDLLQKKLFGPLVNNQFQGGLIPKEKILDKVPMSGTARAMREVKVQHSSGGIAICQFWSYSQGQHAIMGDVVDWVHIDEEPEDPEIYPQVITRLINGGDFLPDGTTTGGKCMLTFTPENGKTLLVSKFMDEDNPGMAMITATWDDAPHITPDKKVAILANYPKYQHAMRSRGVPLMGQGLIFEHDEDDISCDPFEIPDHWLVINGMDFGWDHPWAMVQIAIDEENDVIYVTHSYKKSKLFPHDAYRVTKKWSKDIPVAWPSDGLQTREKGNQKREEYIEEGFDLLDQHATWEAGGVSVQLGIVLMNRMFTLGQLRIFNTNKDLLEEIRNYHTRQVGNKEDGKVEIVKIKDDLIDALRYAIMMRREAIPLMEVLYSVDDDDYDDHHYHKTNAMGY